MILAHNLSSLKASNQLAKTEKSKSSALQNLSSGLRINQASDDSAGLSISEKMKAQIRGLDQAKRNIQDGLSLVQVADQGLGDIMDPNLLRMRELVIQAGDGTLSKEDRQAIQAELDQIKQGIDDIANHTNFNGIKLLSPDPIGQGQGGSASVQADMVLLIDGTGSMSAQVTDFNSNLNNFFSSITTQGVTDIRVGIAIYKDNTVYHYSFPSGQWANNLTDVTNGLTAIASNPANFSGGDETVMNGVVDVVNNYTFDAGASKSVIILSDSGDAGDNTTEAAAAALVASKQAVVYGAINPNSMASEPAGPVKQLIQDSGGVYVDSTVPGWGTALNTSIGSQIGTTTANSGTASDLIMPTLNFQVGANSGQHLEFQLVDARAQSLGITDVAVDPASLIDHSLQLVDDAMTQVAKWQGRFGATENALMHLGEVVANTSVNTSAAQSRIADVDMAKEMMKYTKDSILSQSAQAMLLQANLQPQGVLQLLK